MLPFLLWSLNLVVTVSDHHVWICIEQNLLQTCHIMCSSWARWGKTLLLLNWFFKHSGWCLYNGGCVDLMYETCDPCHYYFLFKMKIGVHHKIHNVLFTGHRGCMQQCGNGRFITTDWHQNLTINYIGEISRRVNIRSLHSGAPPHEYVKYNVSHDFFPFLWFLRFASRLNGRQQHHAWWLKRHWITRGCAFLGSR